MFGIKCESERDRREVRRCFIEIAIMAAACLAIAYVGYLTVEASR